MTTNQQRRLYFPAWNVAANAHGWRLLKGRLVGMRLESWASPELNKLYQQIWNVAAQWASSEARSPRPDDFRHACHVVALGSDRSSSDLSNDQLDRVLALFGLLADPDDLRSMMAWISPNESRRKRILWWIRRNCVESYVAAVCRAKFRSDSIASLSFDQLAQLHITLRNRPNARLGSARGPRAAVGGPPTEFATSANEPF